MKQLKIKQQKLHGFRSAQIVATGGGAYKFYDKIRDALGVNVLREDEMECLVIGIKHPNNNLGSNQLMIESGLDFITKIPHEVFTYYKADFMHFYEIRPGVYPYLLVNFGSGVSMIKVSGARKYQRVGGSSLGGGTLWGLLSLLTNARTFDEVLGMAEQGDNAKVDMLVGDIYGADYDKIGLKSSAVASSFGKVFRLKGEAENSKSKSGTPIPTLSGADISQSLLYAISNNIGQIAYLQSERYSLSNIYFGGSFIRGHKQTMNILSHAIEFWSRGEKKAFFLEHEGYLGALGAFLMG